jgi:predicted dehydrogenase
MTVNAGAIPAEHWTQDREIGGGRLVGEGCHFIDLLRFLAGAAIADQAAHGHGRRPRGDTPEPARCLRRWLDRHHALLGQWPKAFPKERLEVFAGGRVLQLDNFRRLTGFGWPGFSKMNLWRQDKGQKDCATAFVRAVENGGESPIPLDELLEVARVSIEAAGC